MIHGRPARIRLSFIALIFGCAALCPAAPQKDPAALIAQADAERKNGDFAAAERDYKSALQLDPQFAEIHMNLGLVFQLQNRIEDAIPEFRRALEIKPGLLGANFFLGVDYCKMGQGAKAIPYLKTAVAAQPAQKESWVWLATAEEAAGDLHAEAETLRRALTIHRDDIDLLYQLGHAYEQLGKSEVRHLESAAPGSFRTEELLGESYASSSEWPVAVLHLQNAIRSAPDAAGLHVELGEVYLHAGKMKPAAKEFEDELRIDSHSLRAKARQGEIEIVDGDVDGALRDWAEAIAVDETQAGRILGMRETGLGDAAIEQLGDAERQKAGAAAVQIRASNSPAAKFALEFIAIQTGAAAPLEEAATASNSNHVSDADRGSQACGDAEFRESLESERYSAISRCAPQVLTANSTSELRMKAAGALLEAGDYDASLKILAELPAAAQRLPDALFFRARCYEKLATQTYLRLSVAGPDSYRLHQLLGDLEAAKEDDGKAIEEYREAVALKPSLPNLHYSLGHLLWKDLKVADAREEFQAELALNPRHSGAIEDLADTYLLEHQPEKALEYLHRAAAIDARNLNVHRDLGTAYSELGDYRKAAEEFEIALPDDRDGSVHYKLARVYQSLGQAEKASREFAKSSAMNRDSHSKLEKQTERLTQIEKTAE